MTPKTSALRWPTSSRSMNPLEVRFTDLHRYVTELPTFVDDPKLSNEGKLEAIQMAWYEEYQDKTR